MDERTLIFAHTDCGFKRGHEPYEEGEPMNVVSRSLFRSILDMWMKDESSVLPPSRIEEFRAFLLRNARFHGFPDVITAYHELEYPK